MIPSAHSDQWERFPSLLQTVADECCRGKFMGMAIGAIANGCEFTAVSGWADVQAQRAISQSTVFEIGSLSKLFTSLLLAIAARKEEVGLDDPVQAAFGSQVKLPTDGVSQITFRSLANHRSSLPRLPNDLIATANSDNPYAHYDQAMLYACLGRMKTLKPIGSRQTYSNFGVGLLGHALGKLAGSEYRTVLKERVLIPLGMQDTSTGASDEPAPELATSYRKKTVPTPHWDFTEATVAAGGIRSSLADMLRFLRVNLYPGRSEMADALLLMRQPSTLPECKTNCRSNGIWFRALAYVGSLAAFEVSLFGWSWLTRSGAHGLLHLLSMLLPTLTACIIGGRVAGVTALLMMTMLTWWLWGASFAWSSELVWAAIGIYLFSGKRWSTLTQLLLGDGRLAWQSGVIGSQPILWHNGMVGGSASYLGMAPDASVGVVVLTNTAHSVDAVGIQILTKMLELGRSGSEQDAPPSLEADGVIAPAQDANA